MQRSSREVTTIMFDLIILCVALLANIFLALLVISRDPRNSTNRLFFLLVISVICWSIVNYLSYRSTVDTLLFARLVLCLAVAFATVFFFFALVFPRRDGLLTTKKNIAIIAWSLMVMGATLTPLVFAAIHITTKGGLGTPVVGPGIALFGATVVFYDIGGLVILARKALRARGVERMRRLYLFIGLALTLGTIITFNFIFPTVFADTRLIPFAPLFILPFLSSTAYAIVRYHLLDIREATARLTAYILSLGLIGVVYGILIFVLSSFIPSSQLGLQRVTYVMLALLSAFVYPETRKIFAKITNKVFYQDAYDPQVFLDELNKALVDNIELEKLLDICARIIADNFKAEYCLFGIKETGFKDVRLIGTTKKQFGHEDILMARRLTPRLGSNVVVADELPSEASKIKRVLERNDIAVLVRLVPEFASKQRSLEGLGYIMMGGKRSGNMYTSQDIQILGIIANALVIAIQNALRFEEIQRFNVTLQEQVDEATLKLRGTNQKLKALDEAKDEFISMASHQLRTPLTSVKGYLSMALEGDAGPLKPDQRHLVQEAYSSSQRMVYMIADLLNVSRLQTGKFVLEPSSVNFPVLIHEEIEQLEAAVKARGLTMIVNVPNQFPAVRVDENKIRQVIMNFMDNAIFYSKSGGTITLELKKTPKEIIFTVTDDGIGVPAREQAHLFGKFFRASNAKLARPDGTGIGLFMAQKVIDAHRGSIIFKSEENKGSVFGFKLPLESGLEEK